jgi:hypothetical protein
VTLHRETKRWWGSRLKSGVVPARGVAALDESAWQRGKRETSDLAHRRAGLFMIVCAPLFAIGGLFVATTFWWPLRVVVAGVVGLVAAVLALGLISGFYALRAPYRQRNEARRYGRELKEHCHELGEWARRREIADDFRRETLEFARHVSEGGWPDSPDALETHWRANAGAVRAQLREHGASPDVLDIFDLNLDALVTKDDGYGEHHIRRLVNSMQVVCQNVWGTLRAQAAPRDPPAPDRDRSGNT